MKEPLFSQAPSCLGREPSTAEGSLDQGGDSTSQQERGPPLQAGGAPLPDISLYMSQTQAQEDDRSATLDGMGGSMDLELTETQGLDAPSPKADVEPAATKGAAGDLAAASAEVSRGDFPEYLRSPTKTFAIPASAACSPTAAGPVLSPPTVFQISPNRFDGPQMLSLPGEDSPAGAGVDPNADTPIRAVGVDPNAETPVNPRVRRLEEDSEAEADAETPVAPRVAVAPAAAPATEEEEEWEEDDCLATQLTVQEAANRHSQSSEGEVGGRHAHAPLPNIAEDEDEEAEEPPAVFAPVEATEVIAPLAAPTAAEATGTATTGTTGGSSLATSPEDGLSKRERKHINDLEDAVIAKTCISVAGGNRIDSRTWWKKIEGLARWDFPEEGGGEDLALSEGVLTREEMEEYLNEEEAAAAAAASQEAAAAAAAAGSPPDDVTALDVAPTPAAAAEDVVGPTPTPPARGAENEDGTQVVESTPEWSESPLMTPAVPIVDSDSQGNNLTPAAPPKSVIAAAKQPQASRWASAAQLSQRSEQALAKRVSAPPLEPVAEEAAAGPGQWRTKIPEQSPVGSNAAAAAAEAVGVLVDDMDGEGGAAGRAGAAPNKTKTPGAMRMFMGSWTRGDMGSQPPAGNPSQDEPVAFASPGKTFASPGKSARVYPVASQEGGSQRTDPLCSFVPCTAAPPGGGARPEAAEAAGPSETTVSATPSQQLQGGRGREASQAVESAAPAAPVGSSQSPPKAPAPRAGGAAAAAALAASRARRDAEQDRLDHLEAVRRETFGEGALPSPVGPAAPRPRASTTPSMKAQLADPFPFEESQPKPSQRRGEGVGRAAGRACEVCASANLGRSKDRSLLMVCNGCQDAYHMKCHVPAVYSCDGARFLCSTCRPEVPGVGEATQQAVDTLEALIQAPPSSGGSRGGAGPTSGSREESEDEGGAGPASDSKEDRATWKLFKVARYEDLEDQEQKVKAYNLSCDLPDVVEGGRRRAAAPTPAPAAPAPAHGKLKAKAPDGPKNPNSKEDRAAWFLFGVPEYHALVGKEKTKAYNKSCDLPDVPTDEELRPREARAAPEEEESEEEEAGADAFSGGSGRDADEGESEEESEDESEEEEGGVVTGPASKRATDIGAWDLFKVPRYKDLEHKNKVRVYNQLWKYQAQADMVTGKRSRGMSSSAPPEFSAHIKQAAPKARAPPQAPTAVEKKRAREEDNQDEAAAESEPEEEDEEGSEEESEDEGPATGPASNSKEDRAAWKLFEVARYEDLEDQEQRQKAYNLSCTLPDVVEGGRAARRAPRAPSPPPPKAKAKPPARKEKKQPEAAAESESQSESESEEGSEEESEDEGPATGPASDSKEDRAAWKLFEVARYEDLEDYEQRQKAYNLSCTLPDVVEGGRAARRAPRAPSPPPPKAKAKPPARKEKKQPEAAAESESQSESESEEGSEEESEDEGPATGPASDSKEDRAAWKLFEVARYEDLEDQEQRQKAYNLSCTLPDVVEGGRAARRAPRAPSPPPPKAKAKAKPPARKERAPARAPEPVEDFEVDMSEEEEEEEEEEEITGGPASESDVDRAAWHLFKVPRYADLPQEQRKVAHAQAWKFAAVLQGGRRRTSAGAAPPPKTPGAEGAGAAGGGGAASAKGKGKRASGASFLSPPPPSKKSRDGPAAPSADLFSPPPGVATPDDRAELKLAAPKAAPAGGRPGRFLFANLTVLITGFAATENGGRLKKKYVDLITSGGGTVLSHFPLDEAMKAARRGSLGCTGELSLRPGKQLPVLISQRHGIRTEKYIQGMLAGCLVVHPTWVQMCVDAGEVVPPPERLIQRAECEPPRPLDGQVCCFVGFSNRDRMRSVKDLVEMAGARLVSSKDVARGAHCDLVVHEDDGRHEAPLSADDKAAARKGAQVIDTAAAMTMLLERAMAGGGTPKPPTPAAEAEAPAAARAAAGGGPATDSKEDRAAWALFRVARYEDLEGKEKTKAYRMSCDLPETTTAGEMKAWRAPRPSATPAATPRKAPAPASTPRKPPAPPAAAATPRRPHAPASTPAATPRRQTAPLPSGTPRRFQASSSAPASTPRRQAASTPAATPSRGHKRKWGPATDSKEDRAAWQEFKVSSYDDLDPKQKSRAYKVSCDLPDLPVGPASDSKEDRAAWQEFRVASYADLDPKQKSRAYKVSCDLPDVHIDVDSLAAVWASSQAVEGGDEAEAPRRGGGGARGGGAGAGARMDESQRESAAQDTFFGSGAGLACTPSSPGSPPPVVSRPPGAARAPPAVAFLGSELAEPPHSPAKDRADRHYFASATCGDFEVKVGDCVAVASGRAGEEDIAVVEAMWWEPTGPRHKGQRAFKSTLRYLIDPKDTPCPSATCSSNELFLLFDMDEGVSMELFKRKVVVRWGGEGAAHEGRDDVVWVRWLYELDEDGEMMLKFVNRQKLGLPRGKHN